MEKLFNNIEIIDEKTAKNLNTQALAFVGDAVYSLYVRSLLVTNEDTSGKKLHSLSIDYVKASGQSDAIEKLLPILNETEISIFKHARNHKTPSVAKHANIIDYKRATGFEALLGYLYLTNNVVRLNEILKFLKEA